MDQKDGEAAAADEDDAEDDVHDEDVPPKRSRYHGHGGRNEEFKFPAKTLLPPIFFQTEHDTMMLQHLSFLSVVGVININLHFNNFI